MTAYTNPLPSGTNFAEIPDRTKVDAMKQLTADRRDKAIAIPRFVRALNRAGYPIRLAEYKECEMGPLNAVPHINAGMLDYAYRVLNTTRVQNSVQGPYTSRVMTVIGNARIAQGLDYFEVAEKMTAKGVQITEAEYRAAEQGMTKHVPFEWIMTAIDILGLNSREVIG